MKQAAWIEQSHPREPDAARPRDVQAGSQDGTAAGEGRGPALHPQAGILESPAGPHLGCAIAAVAGHQHFQDRWFPAVGHVRQPPDHGVIPGPGAITARTRDGRRGWDAGEHGVVGFDQLPGDGQSKTIEPTKRIKARWSNVRHKGPFGFG